MFVEKYQVISWGAAHNGGNANCLRVAQSAAMLLCGRYHQSLQWSYIT
jgi:hypothetical protein